MEPFAYSDIGVDRLTARKGRQILSSFPPLARGLDRWREGWLEKRDRRLLRRVRESRFDLILVLRGETLSASLFQNLRKSFSGPLATWWRDDPFRHPGLELLPYYDSFFIFDRSYIGRLKKQGARRVEFLACACDETVYSPQKLTSAERKRYRSDVALVAWHYPNRTEVVKALAGLDLKVWGKGWAGAVHGIRSKDTFVEGREASKIYSAASIGLNIHSDQTHQAGLNCRAFELPASGTFQLTDYVEGMEELLLPGKEVAVYRSPEEALERATYYLKRPEERAEILRRGRERALREHTYLHRMRSLLKTMTGASS